MSSMIDCTGVDPKKLLLELWENSKPAAFFSMYPGVPVPDQPSDKELEKNASSYVDYLRGRVIKIDFAKFPSIDPWLYDRDNGTGAAQRVVDKLKAENIG